ncbi:hypothetical protein BJ742DRAFT_400006 [Cladochytrium replicatum]|nr:hypothetical protein BJ742DRAFT_400006 [Cladochytrium replicatum]
MLLLGSRSSSRKGRPSAAATSSLQVTLPEFSAPPLGLNLRSKLIRNLACEAWELPALKQVLISSSEADIKDELQDIAVLDGRGRYQLLDERFADVRPYEWGYTVAERKKALEHMQDAFDRLGFAPDAVERQRLVDPSTIPLVSVTSDKRKAAAVPVTKDETEGAAGDKATPAKRVKAAGAVATLKKKGATAKGKKAAEVDMSKVANHSIKYAEKGVEKKGGSEGAAGESWAGRGRSTRASAKRDQHAEDDQGEPGEVLEFPAKKMPTSTFGYRRNAASPGESYALTFALVNVS